MKFSSRQRWNALRCLHVKHAVSHRTLAIVSNLKLATIVRRATRENWQPGNQLKSSQIGNLIDGIGQLIDSHAQTLNETGEITIKAERQVRLYTSLINALNKMPQIGRPAGKPGKHNQEAGNNEFRHAGEDILALRADIEAFVIGIGEEEPDPAISEKAE